MTSGRGLGFGAREDTAALGLLRRVALAAAVIAAVSVVVAALLAWRLVNVRDAAALAAARCPCCAEAGSLAAGESPS
ncbi:MAG: hypothetical protein KC486_26530 [Myxococcales bacterium]|nr:hypothetical protein [Myxococcales bacterium]